MNENKNPVMKKKIGLASLSKSKSGGGLSLLKQKVKEEVKEEGEEEKLKKTQEKDIEILEIKIQKLNFIPSPFAEAISETIAIIKPDIPFKIGKWIKYTFDSPSPFDS